MGAAGGRMGIVGMLHGGLGEGHDREGINDRGGMHSA